LREARKFGESGADFGEVPGDQAAVGEAGRQHGGVGGPGEAPDFGGFGGEEDLGLAGLEIVDGDAIGLSGGGEPVAIGADGGVGVREAGLGGAQELVVLPVPPAEGAIGGSEAEGFAGKVEMETAQLQG